MIKKTLAEDDTKAGLLLIAYGIVLVAGASLAHGAFSLVSFIALVVADALGMIPVGMGVVMIGQGAKHARNPRAEVEPEYPTRTRPTHCSDCGKLYVESSSAYGFDTATGKPNIVKAQHCPDWSPNTAGGDDPGPCGARNNLMWTNTKPVILPVHALPAHPPGEQPNCPGCLWELVQSGTITQDEADGLAQVFLN